MAALVVHGGWRLTAVPLPAERAALRGSLHVVARSDDLGVVAVRA